MISAIEIYSEYAEKRKNRLTYLYRGRNPFGPEVVSATKVYERR